MIHEWKLDSNTRNFGDALYELLLDQETINEWEADLTKLHYPIGSVICNENIRMSLKAKMTPVFHGCGWRGQPLDPALVKQAEFDGVRGPNTRKELLRHGIDTPVVLDPAYKLPNIYSPGIPNGLAIAIRHIQDKSDYSINTIHELGADAMFSPVIEDKSDMMAFIEKVSGARFVLAGSLHAAIVADAYGVPFALLGGDWIDCPPKWEDWLASIGIKDVKWVDNVKDGRAWYKSVMTRVED
jgi:hypothetical protein